MPARRPRLNATLRYAAAAATLIILALLVISRSWILTAGLRLAPGHRISASLANGGVMLSYSTSSTPAAPPRSPRFTIRRYPLALVGARGLDWWFSSSTMTIPAYGTTPASTHRSVVIPLWSLALPSAAATALAWRRRPRSPQTCPCGYNRAGLPPGAPCPECAAVPR
jgi:hypothetical protein